MSAQTRLEKARAALAALAALGEATKETDATTVLTNMVAAAKEQVEKVEVAFAAAFGREQLDGARPATRPTSGDGRKSS